MKKIALIALLALYLGSCKDGYNKPAPEDGVNPTGQEHSDMYESGVTPTGTSNVNSVSQFGDSASATPADTSMR